MRVDSDGGGFGSTVGNRMFGRGFGVEDERGGLGIGFLLMIGLDFSLGSENPVSVDFSEGASVVVPSHIEEWVGAEWD